MSSLKEIKEELERGLGQKGDKAEIKEILQVFETQLVEKLSNKFNEFKTEVETLIEENSVAQYRKRKLELLENFRFELFGIPTVEQEVKEENWNFEKDPKTGLEVLKTEKDPKALDKIEQISDKLFNSEEVKEDG